VTVSRRARALLRLATVLGLAVVYVPLLVVLVNSLNPSKVFGWPPQGVTLQWWARAAGNSGARTALLTSVEIALCATAVALLLGTMAAFAVARYRWFGRDTVSFLVVLPIALPGIVTGMALNSAFSAGGFPLSLLTVVIGHATFCIVVVYNNVLARLRRTGTTLEEASADLGADLWQTFRLVTFPQLRGALMAGGLLAFALSFDEIVVTQFTISPGLQTLPVWIFGNLFRPNQAPIVNVVAAFLVIVSVVPVYLANRLSGQPDPASAGGRI
jgi:putative spermidine/putrescine transport system permease protein